MEAENNKNMDAAIQNSKNYVHRTSKIESDYEIERMRLFCHGSDQIDRSICLITGKSNLNNEL